MLALNGLRMSEAIGAKHRSARSRTRPSHPDRDAQVAASSSPRRWRRAPPGPSTWLSANASSERSSSAATGNDWTGTPPDGSCGASPAAPTSASGSDRTRCVTPSSPPRLDAGVPLRDVQEAASRADPRTTMRYDRGRQSRDRHLHRCPSSPSPPADTLSPAFDATAPADTERRRAIARGSRRPTRERGRTVVRSRRSVGAPVAEVLARVRPLRDDGPPRSLLACGG
jgi:hypothetical protein